MASRVSAASIRILRGRREIARAVFPSYISLGRPNSIHLYLHPCSRRVRGIQNLATPSNPEPTEKIIYGVQEDPEEVLVDQGGGGVSTITSSSSSSSSSSAAAFVDRTIASTLSAAAITGRSGSQNNLPVNMSQGRQSWSGGLSPRRPNSLQEKGSVNPSQSVSHVKLNQTAPNFHALSSHGPIELYSYISAPQHVVGGETPILPLSEDPAAGEKTRQNPGQWVVFFSHPMDFTPVCTTEIASMAKLQAEFERRGAKVLGLSVGSVGDHQRWMKQVKKLLDGGDLSESRAISSASSSKKIHAVAGVATHVSGGTMSRADGEGVLSDERLLQVGVESASSVASSPGAMVGMGALDEEKELGLEDVVGSGSIEITDSVGKQLSSSISSSSSSCGKCGKEDEGGEGEGKLLGFPIIADEDGFVARLYGMLDESQSTPTKHGAGERSLHPHLQTVRGLFLIDPHRRIRYMSSYPHTTGRNMAEVVRVLDALIKSDCEGVMTGEAWTAGDEVIIPPEMSDEEAQRRFGEAGVRRVNEYLRFTHS